MNKSISLLLFYIISYNAFGQINERLDSLLKVPGLYLIGLPGDGPREALKGLKPTFCNDIKTISTFFELLKQKKDTAIEGHAYYNYVIQAGSDSTGLYENIAFTFEPQDLSYANTSMGGEFYTFNMDAINYLKANFIKLRETKFRLNKQDDIRKFQNHLLNTHYTYYSPGSDYIDSTYLKHDGYITIQIEYPREMESKESKLLIRNKINSFLKQKDYYLIERIIDYRDSTKVTSTIEVYTNKENIAPLSEINVIEDWKPHEELEFSVFSYYIKDIIAYYLTYVDPKRKN